MREKPRRRPAAVCIIAALLCLAGTARAGADELLVMPYSCTVVAGRPALAPSPRDESYRILGPREQQLFTACSPVNRSVCRSWLLHRFDLDCGGARVSWLSVVAAAAQRLDRPVWVDNGRLRVGVGRWWNAAPDEPYPRWSPGRYGREYGERRFPGPPPVVEMPPGFAPTLGTGAQFVSARRPGPQTAYAPPPPARGFHPVTPPASVYSSPPPPPPVAEEFDAPGPQGRPYPPPPAPSYAQQPLPPPASVAAPPPPPASDLPAVSAPPPPAPKPAPARTARSEPVREAAKEEPAAQSTTSPAPAPAPLAVPKPVPAVKPAARSETVRETVKEESAAASPPAPPQQQATQPVGTPAAPRIINRPEASSGEPPRGQATGSVAVTQVEKTAPAGQQAAEQATQTAPPVSASEPNEGAQVQSGPPSDATRRAQDTDQPMATAFSLLNAAGGAPLLAIAAFAGITLVLLATFALARRRERAHALGGRPREFAAASFAASGPATHGRRVEPSLGPANAPPAAPRQQMLANAPARAAPLPHMGSNVVRADWRSGRVPETRAEALTLLGVGPDADEGAIKKIVDGLRQSWHPDHAKTDADRQMREHRLKQINVAWELICGRRPAA